MLLEFALMRWAMEELRGEGFEPVVPPVLVREETMVGTGYLPDTEQQIYRLADDDLYLAGTSEVALASLHAGEIVDGARLPLRYAGFSACFRREAGAAGRDTRGIFRVHQFDKLEMFAFVEPEKAVEEHERLLALEERFLQALEIPYRVVNIGVTDLGASAIKKYDCEAWMPGQERYREVTSTSNTTEFQSRRLDIRYRPAAGRRAAPRRHAERHGRDVAAPDRAARERPARRRHASRSPRCCSAGVRRRSWGRRPGMSETPITPQDPDIPESPPSGPEGPGPRATTSRSARRPTSIPRTRRCPACPRPSRPRASKRRTLHDGEPSPCAPDHSASIANPG